MALFGLVKAGYGSLIEIESLPVKRVLDMIEYENILNDIEANALRDK